MLGSKVQNGTKHIQPLPLFFIPTFSHNTRGKKEVSQVGLFEDPCIKAAFKNNIKAEKLS